MKKTYLILVVLLALLISCQAIRPPFAVNFKTGIVDLAKFPFRVFTKTARGVYNFATFKNRYEKRIAILEKRIELLMKDTAARQEIFTENQRLRGLLSFKSRQPPKTIAAEVIARDPASLESFIIIDKGQRDGIALNMSVARPEGFIGRVFEAGASTAKVMLIDNPNSRIAAAIQRTREQGILVGSGRGLCKLIYLSYDTDAKAGDIVVVNALKNMPPEGLLIGEVTKVLRQASSLYASAVVKPSCNLFKVEEVLCVE